MAFLVPSSPELLLALLGALRSGVVAVPLNPALLPEERTALLADAEPGLVVDDDAGLAELLAGSEAELAPAPLSRPMHYTSGTTGRPKGVWSGVLSPDDSAALLAEEAAVWNFGPDDVHLVCSPLHHSVAIRFSAGTLLAGGSVVVLPRFEARAAIAAIAEYRPTTAFMVPAHLQRLFASGDLPDLSSLR
ncbi:MAG: AMP-binding protein, partial [Actinobacteria bacterium]|nr:AMP-binding protein [Actinomycetota bacterium]